MQGALAKEQSGTVLNYIAANAISKSTHTIFIDCPVPVIISLLHFTFQNFAYCEKIHFCTCNIICKEENNAYQLL